MAIATARLSSTIGDGACRASAPYSAAISGQSVSSGPGLVRATPRSRPGPDTARGFPAPSPGRALRLLHRSCRDPTGPVLVLEQNEFAGRIDSRLTARVLQEHERQEAHRLGLAGTAATRRASARSLRRRAHTDERSFGGGVSLVEDQIEHGQHAVEALREELARRDSIGDARVPDLLLRSHETLLNRRLVAMNARAISRVESPPTVRSVRATRDSIGSAG